MRELSEDTWVVFVSDSHIGGDPGCDGFESPEELEALFEELAEYAGPTELILAGDFFDFLQIGDVPEAMDRAAVTISRPEYVKLFAALERFRSGERKRVVYLPGNHDAEMWWNPKIQETLRRRGLVDEFAFSYLASFEVEGKRRIVYCEHGNQLDPANTVEDYGDSLDTPVAHDEPAWFLGNYRELLPVHRLFLDIGFYGLLTLLIFAIFFFVVRRVVQRTVATVSFKQRTHYSPAESSQNKIRKILLGEAPPPMDPSVRPEDIDVFVSGHTHLPSLDELETDGVRRVVVNSGCWLRQLQPVSPYLKGPPVFVSKFVLTHVRVFVQGSSLRVELWEHPKPAEQRLTKIERLLSWNRRPPQPPAGSEPRVRATLAL